MFPHTSEDSIQTCVTSIQSEIDLIELQFTSGVELDEEGDFEITHAPGKVTYVGDPSPEIDQAWFDLQAGLNIDLEIDEANMKAETFQWPETGLFFSG
ncbi:hypothetical protein F5Y15DRAFT_411045 [Xylariaceae sp. FL0016]|nr:hypothetical protein F5Y15DRAFT_411045 [Xylariaceae sp. FL0016]